MQYILSELTLHNFGPFKGTQKLTNVESKSIICVLGEYDGIKGKSNRSGKSFLLEAFTYLLTGKSRADNETELIHNGEEVMWVEGKFISEDLSDTKVIKRGRDLKGKGVLEVDWIEKSSDAKQAIKDTLGVDPSDFETTAFFKQSDIEGFMRKKPSEQSEDMMKWMDNGHWIERSERVKKDVSSFRNKLKDVESAKRAFESSLDSVEALQIHIDENNKEADKLDIKLKSIEKEINKYLDSKEELSSEINKYKSDRNDLLSKISDAKRNEVEINRTKSHIENYTNKVDEISSLLECMKQYSVDDTNKLSNSIGSLNAETSRLATLIKDIKSSKGVCPILGSKCDLISNESNNYDEEYSKLSNKIKEYKSTLLEANKFIRLNDELNNNELKLSEYNEKLNKLGSIDVSQYESKSKKLDNLINDKSTKLTELNEKISESDKVANELSNKIKAIESDIKVLEHRISVYDETLKKIEEKDLEASKLRVVIADLSDIAIMFSKYGIPADEIDNSLGTIQDKVNMILKLSGMDLSMSFEPDKELKAKEVVCLCGYHFPKGHRGNCPECGMERQNKRKTEMNIKIIENGKERKFKMDSGGGRALISFAVRIAINLIKKEQGKMKLNMLFLDEVDAPFDEFHLNKLISIITTTLINSFHYGQIILISHNKEIRDSVDDIIRVVRYGNDTSKIFDN